MSFNRYQEMELCQWDTKTNCYFISRDKAGNHVLREGSYGGKELFSPVGDNGTKNRKGGRVANVDLLYAMIEFPDYKQNGMR